MGAEKKTTEQTYQLSLSANAVQNIDEITGYIAFINRQSTNAIRVGDAIIYKITGKRILILGVLHHSRKPSVIKSLKKII